MKHIKLFEEYRYIKIDNSPFNVKDPNEPFFNIPKSKYIMKKSEDEWTREVNRQIDRNINQSLENENNEKVIIKIVDCINKDDNCIVNVKDAKLQHSISSEGYIVILSNGIKFTLISDEDDAGWVQEYFIKVLDDYYRITKKLYDTIKEKIDIFNQKTWDETNPYGDI